VILVDTSIWVDHSRASDARLVQLLAAELVLAHPHVIGEVMLGSLRDRASIFGELRDLPRAVVATDDEVLRLIKAEALYGLGIGYVDAHLLASTRLTDGALLWSRDRRLATAAAKLGIAVGLAR
jgi:predicted nucleic acid-binding protein